MRWSGLAMLVCVVAAVAPRADAQSGKVTSEIRVFVDRLRGAGWTGQANAGGVTFTARGAPLCSNRMLDALNAKLDDERKKILADLARVTFEASGWLLNFPVSPGTYSIGMEQAPRYLRLTITDPKGERVGTLPISITGTTDQSAQTFVEPNGGAATAILQCGDIRFRLRYIRKTVYAETTGVPTAVTNGRVTLRSDLGSKAILESLAAACEAAIPVHAQVLGVPEPKAPFTLYLYATAAQYRKVDALLTGGKFADNGAFASDATHAAFVWHVPISAPVAFDDHGATHQIRALLLHELHHLVSYRYYKGTSGWPLWMIEGLAEYATWKALGAASPDEGAWFLAQAVGRWRYERSRHAVPALEDLLGDGAADMRSGFYRTAFFWVRHLEASKPGRVGSLATFIEAEPLLHASHAHLLRVLETEWGPALTQWKGMQRGLAGEPPAPARIFGHVDRVGTAYRLISAPERQARLVLPQTFTGPDATVTGEFAFHPVGSQQADVYLGYRMGRNTGRLLKVAIGPKWITFLSWRHGRWAPNDNVNYKQELPVGNPKKPTWHGFKIHLDHAKRTIRVDTAAGRWASFRVPEHVTLAGTQCAVGCWGGAAFFRNIVAK